MSCGTIIYYYSLIIILNFNYNVNYCTLSVSYSSRVHERVHSISEESRLLLFFIRRRKNNKTEGKKENRKYLGNVHVRKRNKEIYKNVGENP